MRTPAVAKPATSSRLRGSSSQLRTDSASTGPISFVDCSASSEAASSASIDPNARASTCAAALADVANAEPVDQRATSRSFCSARSVRRPSPRSSRRTAARSPCRPARGGARQRRPAAPRSGHRCRRSRERARSRSAARSSDSPSPSMFIAPREAKCSRPRCSLRRTRGVLASPHGFVFCAMQLRCRTPGMSVGITHGCRSAGRLAEHRTDDARDHVACLLDDHPVAGRGCPCARCRRRCAASPSRRSCRRRTPVRAPRTASPRRCGRR